MRVLRVLDSLDPATGGPPSVFSAAVVSTAAAGATIECLTLRPTNADVTTFPDHQRLVANGIKVHVARDFLAACALIYRRARDFDVIHVDGCWVPISIVAVLIAKIRGRCSVVTPHETLTFEERRRTRSRVRGLIKQALTRYYLVLAGCIVHSSGLEQRDSPPHRNSIVIPHPVFDGAAPVSVRSGLVAPPEIQLGYLGRFHAKKNLENIVGAGARTGGVRLHLAGSGPDAYERALKSLADGSDNLHWLGFLKKERREKFFRDIDFLVLASEYECFGMAAAEAMVRGIPVIVTERVGVTDDVRATGCGLVVAVGTEPLMEAFEWCTGLTAEQYGALQSKALVAAARYSYAAHGRSQVGAYRRMLELRQPRRPVR
ncbi:glycosyltransferase [Bradyrhizobium sp. INPA01-394B]|uniref:Glycosyltransferase n=1 Tax=Bradyrhizobium campsiandrae TaxID=1729892 RepID=A0ABR7U9I3_9BRAD|nr:glycosyltransferase [Bradyrhizobium campsiandrae]MBC9879336.1 glycosyltransferase [Bradyrhizobium campsiandrae]MBC9980734.1 glycosyltransferase [Bradyrhizobium campsiandrae]